jgi:6-phosphogluconolactonase
MTFYKTSSLAPAADYLANNISVHLRKGERVLWLVSGGSAIKVAVAASTKLNNTNPNLEKLAISLTDERYVPAGHHDSNWQQLLDAGFSADGATLYPLLNQASDQINTANYYDKLLRDKIHEADYRIGLFGMGPDGHIAALFPHFPELNEDQDYAVSLNNSPKPPPNRMTMTIPAIKKLDEAVLFTQGEEKRPQLEKLGQRISINEQPAQALKLASKLTIFNDQIGEEV